MFPLSLRVFIGVVVLALLLIASAQTARAQCYDQFGNPRPCPNRFAAARRGIVDPFARERVDPFVRREFPGRPLYGYEADPFVDPYSPFFRGRGTRSSVCPPGCICPETGLLVPRRSPGNPPPMIQLQLSPGGRPGVLSYQTGR